jgi:hypothetical protein
MSETKPTIPKHQRGLARSDQVWWREDADYAIAIGLDRPSDPEREGFGWRVPDQAFWKRWRADKVAMKAEGYRVTRGDDGHWLVCFTPKPERKLPAAMELARRMSK